MTKLAAAALALLSTWVGPALALTPLPPQPAEVAWPVEAWPMGAPVADVAALEALMREAFEAPPKELGETRAVVVIQGGRLVLERHAEGYGPQTRHVSWSVAKSFTQALVGAAALQGRLDPEAPMGSPRWPAYDARQAMSWKTWLQMVDGQRYVEIEAPGVTRSDAAGKLFGRGRADVAGYCAALPTIHPPRVHWNYNSCGIVLTADALTRTIVGEGAAPDERRARMRAWMQESLFGPLGMRSATFEFDPEGLYYGSALLYATAQDFAKFGLLYLRDGVWNGRRLVPPGWVDFARTPGPGRNADVYGAGWWLAPETGEGRPYPALIQGGPRDAFSAQGHEGQYILVVPSKDLVVVRLGLTDLAAERGALGRWMTRLVNAFPDAEAPPA